MLYLNVPYNEKEEAKFLGAKWNPRLKKWYINASPEEYIKFAKWILRDSDEAIIAIEHIFIIEGQQKCWKCKRTTTVIGLGICDFITIYGDIDDPQFELENGFGEPGEELHLAWVEKEEDIPPKLLKYIKENYSVKTGYSKTIRGKCFANHCECCGALQGNHYLFTEPSSPLSSSIDGDELIERMSKLKLMCISIDDDLQLNWYISICSNDYAYFPHGQFKELLSAKSEDGHFSYEVLYNL